MLQITYDKDAMADGLGAQMQRIIYIHAIGKVFKLRTPDLRIKNILLHPQDGIKDKEEYLHLIDRTNEFLDKNFGNKSKVENPIQIPLLTNKILLKSILKYAWRRKNFTIITNNPYAIVERFPRIINKLLSSGKSEPNTLVMHLRYSGNKAGFILKNEKETRNLQISRYQEIFENIKINSVRLENVKIKVVTDSTLKPKAFEVPFGQEKIWIDSGYHILNGKIDFEPDPEIESFISYLKNSYPIELKRGGDPLECLIEMMNADILVMSRSSLSYSAALLGNQSIVYYPRDFWHTPLKGWQPY